MIVVKIFFLYKINLFKIMIKHHLALFKSKPWILEESHKYGEKLDFLNQRTIRSNN